MTTHRFDTRERGVCALRRDVLSRVGDKWTALVLLKLENGPRRYSDMNRSSTISDRMLTLTLRELHRDGLITRTPAPDGVAYALTPPGRSLCALITSLVDWADEQQNHITRSRADYDAAVAS